MDFLFDNRILKFIEISMISMKINAYIQNIRKKQCNLVFISNICQDLKTQIAYIRTFS